MARSPMLSATFCPASSSTSATTTAAPSSANRRASASPCPRDAPVMIATLPSSAPAIVSSVSLLEPGDDLLAPLAHGFHAHLVRDGAHLNHRHDFVDADLLEMLDELDGVVGIAEGVVDAEGALSRGVERHVGLVQFGGHPILAA